MSLKRSNLERIIVQEEVKKPISFRHKRKDNNYTNSEKIKIPLYNNPLYIKTETNPIENTNYETQNENKIIDLTYNQNFHNKKVLLNKNNSQKNIYVKKNIRLSPQRCNSERELNNNFFLSKINNTYQTYSNSINNIKNKNYNRIKEINNNNQNIININLIKEKNNYIENNIINKFYINKNKNRKNTTKVGKFSLSNSSINNKTEDIKKNINLTESNSFRRKSHYINHYLIKNDLNKINNPTINQEKETNSKRTIMNYLSKTTKPIEEYNEFCIIKIQSVFRGFLLNKRLDKILRYYINIKEAEAIIKRFFQKKVIKNLIQFKQKKRYQHQNIYYCKKRNYSQYDLNNVEKNDNIHLQMKINELINEKNQIQTNYNNLREFMNKYKQLINEKAEMLQEIDNLRKTINKLQNIKRQKLTNNKAKVIYIIQKQKSLKVINHKNMIINSNETNETKKDQNINAFLTLGKESIDNNDAMQNDKNELKKCKIKYLLKNKENKIKIILNKYFYKFYYLGLKNNINKSENNKPKISVINRRYKVYNNYENANNFLSHISIKTLSDNSSAFNDGKGRNLSILTGLNFTDEDNKKK